MTITKTSTDYKARISKLTKKLMAAVSELSMYQAQAMQLQTQLEEKQQAVASGKERMEQGLAPSAEIEEEWLRMHRRLDQTKREEDEATHASQGAPTHSRLRIVYV